jgi:PRC-barrel domain
MAERTAGQPSVEEALAWAGASLDEMGGVSVGRVEGVYVDTVEGSPQWLLVRLGRLGRYSLLPFQHAVGGAGHVWVPYDRSAIRSAPRIEPGGDLTRELELELCAHFGAPEGGGRSAELRGREPGSPTARPAATG